MRNFRCSWLHIPIWVFSEGDYMRLRLKAGFTEYNLASYQEILKQHENKKVFETMMSLAQLGELTPERYALLISVVSNQEENEV